MSWHFMLKACVTSVNAEANMYTGSQRLLTNEALMSMNSGYYYTPCPVYTVNKGRSVRAAVPKDYARNFSATDRDSLQ